MLLARNIELLHIAQQYQLHNVLSAAGDTLKVQMVGGQKQGGHWVSPVFLVNWLQTPVCFMVFCIAWPSFVLTKSCSIPCGACYKGPMKWRNRRTRCCKAAHGLGYVPVEYVQAICPPLWLFLLTAFALLQHPFSNSDNLVSNPHQKKIHKSTMLVLPS